MIRQPDFVTTEILEAAKSSLSKKKPQLDVSFAKLEKITEGLCVQMMHVGSYDDEPASVMKLDDYAIQNGYLLDFRNGRRHHEIYLSDPRKTASEKLKTILRHPVHKK